MPAGEDMTREESCAKAVVCDIAVSGHGEADVGMPADDEHGLTQRLTEAGFRSPAERLAGKRRYLSAFSVQTENER